MFFCCLTVVSASDNLAYDSGEIDSSQSYLSIDDSLDEPFHGDGLNSVCVSDSSQEVLSAGESPDNPATDADQLWLRFHSIGEASTANIYLDENVYSYNNKIFDSPKNVTFIGKGENTVLKGISTQAGPGVQPSEKNYAIPYTFVNLTFVGGSSDLSRGCNFINCTIVDSLTFSKDFNDNPDKLNIRHTTQDYYALRTYFFEFDNCVFKDFNGNGSYLTLYQFSCVSFNNCNFTNISADSIACYASDVSYEKISNYLLKLGWMESEIEKISYDGINFNNCLFKDSTYTAVTDSYTALSRSIVNCEDIKSDYYGVFTSSDNLHQYFSLPIPADTYLTVNVDDIVYGDSFVINARFNNAVCDDVIVSFNRNRYSVKVVNGSGSLKVLDELDAGVWNFVANSSYNHFNFNSSFTVNKVNTKLSAPAVSSVYGKDNYLLVTLKDSRGNALNNALVTVHIGSEIYKLKTDVKGQVKVSTANLIPKKYAVSVKYNGDGNLFSSSLSSSILVSKASPKLTAKKASFKVKVKTKKYSIVLKTNKNKALAKAKVTLKVKGKTYRATTNAKGKATFKIKKLNKKGTYNGTVKFAGNACFKAVSKKVKIFVKR